MIKEAVSEMFGGCLKWVILAVIIVAGVSFSIGYFI